MQGQFINNIAPGNFGAPGVYIFNAPTQQITPTGPALGKLGVIGTGQTGLKNVPTLCTTPAAVIAAFGPNTTLNNSITRDACAAMPECNQVVGLRVTDTTDTAAIIAITDASAGVVLTLTALMTGSLPNGVNALGAVTNPATGSVSLIAGQYAASGTVVPMAKIAITYPNQPTGIFTVVAGTASAGYVPATFKANAIAAINTGTQQLAPSAFFTASAGASLLSPAATVFNASGGTDGATTITSSVLQGIDGTTGRTGMYALRGAINGGQFIFAGYYMAASGDTTPQAAVAFNNSEGTRCGFSLPQGTQTTGGITIKSANNATDPTLDVFIDWVQMTDQWTFQATYVAPHAKGMGIISSLDFYQGPLNQPQGAGAIGILATEKYTGGINLVGGGEYATRTQAGLNFISKPSGVWALSNPYTSNGTTFVSDARAAWYFGIGFMSVCAPFLGRGQSNLPNDKTRANVKAAMNAFMVQQLNPIQKISGYSNICDLSNNTTQTIAQGFLMDNIAVQTLSNVVIILVQSQVGVGVQLTVPAA